MTDRRKAIFCSGKFKTGYQQVLFNVNEGYEVIAGPIHPTEQKALEHPIIHVGCYLVGICEITYSYLPIQHELKLKGRTKDKIKVGQRVKVSHDYPHHPHLRDHVGIVSEDMGGRNLRVTFDLGNNVYIQPIHERWLSHVLQAHEQSRT